MSRWVPRYCSSCDVQTTRKLCSLKDWQPCPSRADSTACTWQLPWHQGEGGVSPQTSSGEETNTLTWKAVETAENTDENIKYWIWLPLIMWKSHTKWTNISRHFRVPKAQEKCTGKMSTSALLKWSKYLVKMAGMTIKNKNKKKTASENSGWCKSPHPNWNYEICPSLTVLGEHTIIAYQKCYYTAH